MHSKPLIPDTMVIPSILEYFESVVKSCYIYTMKSIEVDFIQGI